MPENRLVIHKWTSRVKNSLLGFATVELPNGLYIHDISIHGKGSRRWAMMPATAQMEGDKQRVVDGKAQWKKLLEWRSRELSDQFSERLIEAIKQQHPGAFQ